MADTTIVLAVSREYSDEQVAFWLESCAQSGTTSPVRVLTSRRIGVLPDGSYKSTPQLIEPLLEGPGDPTSVDLVSAQAYGVYGDCLVMRPDAVPIRSLDDVDSFKEPFMLSQDAAMRRDSVFGFEFSSAVMLLRCDVWHEFFDWWKMTRNRVRGDDDARSDALNPQNYGQVLLSYIFSERNPAVTADDIRGLGRDQAERKLKELTLERSPLLPREWCWSRTWAPTPEARVVWYHGAPGRELRRGFQHHAGFFS